MDIVQLTPTNYNVWDEFVKTHSEGTLFHSSLWKEIIERSFDYNSYYFMALEDDQVQGILPLFHVKGWLSGNALISTPFAVYGGILANHLPAQQALLRAAQDLAQQFRAHYIELRHRGELSLDGLHTKDSVYATFIKKMPEQVEDIYQELPKEARRMVRKGRQHDLELTFESHNLDQFYNIYAVSVQKFGTPVFPKKLFRNCFDVLEDQTSMLYVYKNGNAIAAVLSFYYKDTVYPYYAGMLPEAKTLAPHNLMYLTLMEQARNSGYSTFDFGRSKLGTGAAKFKEHMGLEPTPLPYQFYLKTGRELPNKNQTNSTYALASNVWKRLPLGMTKLIGPHVVKLFP